MAMSWTSLTGAKTVAGSIAKWTGNTLLDTESIVDEAQALIYMAMRTREMRTAYHFTMTQGMSFIGLPARFLDPIGRIRQEGIMSPVRHVDQGMLTQNRF